jgi:hypothetical protein
VVEEALRLGVINLKELYVVVYHERLLKLCPAPQTHRVILAADEEKRGQLIRYTNLATLSSGPWVFSRNPDNTSSISSSGTSYYRPTLQ